MTRSQRSRSSREARQTRRASRRVSVAIVSTGSEILQGLYPDTNAQWLAGRLDALGFDVDGIRAVSDGLDHQTKALEGLLPQVDLILTTGGLGPTEDDRFREACSRAWNRPLQHSAAMMRAIEARYRKAQRIMPEANRRQALIPRGAEPLKNAWGTAPGFAIAPARGRAGLIALPGPPVEMQPMFEKRALPWLREHVWPAGVRRRATIHTIGWPESRMNEVLADLFTVDPDLDFTILARSGKIDVRLTARGNTAEEARDLLERHRRAVRRRLPDEIIYGLNDETLEQIVNRLCAEHGLTIAVAESCTGGLIAQRLTSVPGASRILTQSVITYADDAKRKILGVRASTLRRHGAVSEACVREMAAGVRRWSGADVGLAVSGIAGPTGGTREKPVGLVHWAADTEAGILAEHFICHRKERDSIRLWSADRALDAARRAILDLVKSR